MIKKKYLFIIPVSGLVILSIGLYILATREIPVTPLVKKKISAVSFPGHVKIKTAFWSLYGGVRVDSVAGAYVKDGNTIGFSIPRLWVRMKLTALLERRVDVTDIEAEEIRLSLNLKDRITQPVLIRKAEVTPSGNVKAICGKVLLQGVEAGFENKTIQVDIQAGITEQDVVVDVSEFLFQGMRVKVDLHSERKGMRWPEKITGNVFISGVDLNQIIKNAGMKRDIYGTGQMEIRIDELNQKDFMKSRFQISGSIQDLTMKNLPVQGDLEWLFNDKKFRRITYSDCKFKWQTYRPGYLKGEINAAGDFMNFKFNGSLSMSGYANGSLTLRFEDAVFQSLSPSLARMAFSKNDTCFYLKVPFKGPWDNPRIDLEKIINQKVNDGPVKSFLKELFSL